MKKKISFRISAKIGLGFGILTIALVINAIRITNVLNDSRALNDRISKVYQPSEAQLVQLHDVVNNSQALIKSWVFVDKVADTPDKKHLEKIHKVTFPKLDGSLSMLSDHWDVKDQQSYRKISSFIRDTLFVYHRDIMEKLSNIDHYNDPGIMFDIIPLVSDSGVIVKHTDSVLSSLEGLIENQKQDADQARASMEDILTRLKNFILFTSIFLVLVSLVVAFLTVRSLVLPINYMKSTLLLMSKGILPRKAMEGRSDEIGEMSVALNSHVEGLKAISDFALEIGRGNYNTSFKPASKDDVLGNSLLQMRDDLKGAAEEEQKRKVEDQQRNWATAGIAKFSDILRKNNDKLDVLSYNVVSNLVDYLGANQGGIFVVGEDEMGNACLDLVACYAYNRQKFLTKRFEMNEGLVGRCALERETIFLTDVPDNYIRINSGLGDANPRCLLLVPMMMNDELFGVFELASFNILQSYQVEFVEKIAETIASTLSTVRFNMQTAKLLEQSKIQAEELATREEEMRQNMEELRATQEQSARREVELQKRIEQLLKKNA
ncbi:MAG TPA: GAF domain-containing protein [Bacteroidales bacterium]|nr:GAF domain-containing protein [Bacteroidales bacterium]